MIITKSLRNSVVRVTTTEYGNGWAVKVEVDGETVHDDDMDVYVTEEDALQAADVCASAIVAPLH